MKQINLPGMLDQNLKPAYICGPLTELYPKWLTTLLNISSKQKFYSANEAKQLYTLLGQVCTEEMNTEAFVPHHHNDPVLHPNNKADDVYRTEVQRIETNTGVLVVVGIQSTWGGGGEVQIAKYKHIPAILLKPRGQKISRFLLGNPVGWQTFLEKIEFDNFEQAAEKLRAALHEHQLVPQKELEKITN